MLHCFRQIREHADKITCILIQQCADNASSNKREVIFTEKILPPNVFHVADFCSAHRLHRIIATVSDENTLAGDVFSIVYASTLTTVHEKVLRAWRGSSENSYFGPRALQWQLRELAQLLLPLPRPPPA